MIEFWALIKSLPSTFWQSVLAGLKAVGTFISGSIVESLWDNMRRSQKLVEQFKELQELEKSNNSRSTRGATDRLRNSGYTRD